MYFWKKSKLLLTKDKNLEISTLIASQFEIEKI